MISDKPLREACEHSGIIASTIAASDALTVSMEVVVLRRE
jgi:hypothetical protein